MDDFVCIKKKKNLTTVNAVFQAVQGMLTVVIVLLKEPNKFLGNLFSSTQLN